jgi:sugar-specific transcriptional regulator TrmB
MNIQEALQIIGLSDKEAAVYTALLQLGQATAYGVAVKSGLKKPTTYVILDELIEKGLVLKVPQMKTQHYIARSPEEAFGVAQERLTLAKKALPELLAITKGKKSKVNTVYFEGVEGMKQLLEYKLKEHEGEEMLGFWATDKNADPELARYFKNELAKKIQRHGIRMRGLAPADPTLADYRAVDAGYGRNIKEISTNDYSTEVAITVTKDLVRIEDYKNLQGIAIENQDVAKALRQIFEMVWKKY